MNETTDAASIFAPLWRRKWLILTVAVVVAVGSYLDYKREKPTYEASTELYLGAASEEVAPGEKASKTSLSNVTNQASVINSIVVEGVRHRLRNEHKAALTRGAIVRAKSSEKGQFITIETEAHSGKAAALLANLVAQAYIARQGATRHRTVERAIAIARRQVRRIEASDAGKAGTKGPSTASILQTAALNTKINELESSLELAGAEQIKPAKGTSATLLGPEPKKDAIFGFVIGLVLASIAAYVLSRFDRRLRSLAGVEEAFHAQILAALPRVRRPIVHRDGLPSPSRVLLEPLRRLHASLQVNDARGEQDAETSRCVLLVMSPDAGDGKSTLVADLALIKRDAGERVAVVEANFRRPVQAKLLGLHDAPGLADVLAGALPLEEAMLRVLPMDQALQADRESDGAGVATAVRSRAGSLFLLAGGGSVPNPPAALAQPAMHELLRALAAEYDCVLLDAPSPLEVSDVMPLLQEVDGIMLVARIGHTRETSAGRLVQVLGQTNSAPVLGVAANCVAPRDLERYGFSSPSGKGWPRRLRGR
ncbi:MAG: Wzz/FepE/Etk N-terminal domain-containing protein [Solirubrobacteraceae bacterium]|jgi:Mrp family chromosome partitioning ATPase/capsular polysaccharide biosynthesis protein